MEVAQVLRELRIQVNLKEGAMNVVDTVIVFRILKNDDTKVEEMDAYKFGLIDDNGKRIKSKKPKTQEEKTHSHYYID